MIIDIILTAIFLIVLFGVSIGLLIYNTDVGDDK